MDINRSLVFYSPKTYPKALWQQCFLFFLTQSMLFFIQFSSDIVKDSPADEALCVMRLSSLLLLFFHKIFLGDWSALSKGNVVAAGGLTKLSPAKFS